MVHLPTAVLLLLTTTASAFTALSPASLKALGPATPADFDHETGALLAPILIPRVPGTANSLKVLTHFQHFFTQHLPLWQLRTQNSSATTPTSNGKKLPFRNFIATRDPPWAAPGNIGRLVLVAHYDSKLTPDGFIGATDSAAPCAMLLHTARALDAALTRKWDAMTDPWAREDERGVMILLLDGEEAFQEWSDTDSLYGARSLAEHWEGSRHPAMSTRRTELASIDLFVLLDLLGSTSPQIRSYYSTTHWAYLSLARTEQQLRRAGLFESHKKYPQAWMSDGGVKELRMNAYGGGIEDDHIPFLNRGVSVLHLIPSPFPRVWHTVDDDGHHLHPETVRDWARLVTAWSAGWLGLDEWIVAKGEQGKGGKGTVKTEL
ncbi:peptidase M28 [Geopyxis carbonaria]|nr:peptidase M28 [Geopyxis carbonaria]